MCGGGDLVFVDETIREPLSGTLAGKGCVVPLLFFTSSCDIMLKLKKKFHVSFWHLYGICFKFVCL